MAALELDDLHQRIAMALAAITANSDGHTWREAPTPFDLFGDDEATREHMAFAVGLPATSWDSDVESSLRKRGIDGGLVGTAVGVRWTFGLRPDSGPSDYRLALGVERALVHALINMDVRNLHIALQRQTRRAAGLWVVGEIQAAASHRLSLS